MTSSPFIFDEDCAVVSFYLSRAHLSLELKAEPTSRNEVLASIVAKEEHEIEEQEPRVEKETMSSQPPVVTMDHAVVDAMTKLHISECDENACLMAHRPLHRIGVSTAVVAKPHTDSKTESNATEEWTVVDTIKACDIIELASDLEPEPKPCASASSSCTIEGMEGVPVEIIAVPLSSPPQTCPERPLNRSISSQVLEAVNESISPELKTIYPVIMTNDITMDPATLVCKESKEKGDKVTADASPPMATSCCPSKHSAPCASSPTAPSIATKLGASCSIL